MVCYPLFITQFLLARIIIVAITAEHEEPVIIPRNEIRTLLWYQEQVPKPWKGHVGAS